MGLSTLQTFIKNALIEENDAVAKFAISLGVPVVMISWSEEFRKSDAYHKALKRSIHDMSMYETAPVSMVLDVLSNNYTENSYGAYTIPAEILTDRDKQKIIRDTFEAVVTGNASAADNLHRIVLDSGFPKKPRSSSVPSTEMLYGHAKSIIFEQKSMFANAKVLGNLLDYIESNKTSIASMIANILVTQKFQFSGPPDINTGKTS